MLRTVVVSRAEERMKWALFATHTCPERKFAASLAVQTVQHEPFSRGNSLLTGKFSGNSGQSLLGNREERPVRQHFSGVGAA